MTKSVFFDLDDTLVYKSSIIDAKREQAKILSKVIGCPESLINEAMDRIDTNHSRLHGFNNPSRFGDSMIMTASELLHRYTSPDEVQNTLDNLKPQLKELAYSAMTAPSTLIDGAIEAIKHCKDLGYRTHIVTKGAYSIQNRAVRDNQLHELVDQVFILNQKTLQEMYQVLMTTGSQARGSWFVGNSPRSDVNPAYRAGMNALYIPHPDTWVAEMEPVLEGVITISSIKQLQEVIK